MADSFMLRNILIIVILCLVVLFISGIALPMLFSQKYFQLRSELNSQKNILEPQSKVLTEMIETLDNTSHGAIPKNENFQLTLTKDFELNARHSRKLKRRKREAFYENGKRLSWHFNLNVTQYENSINPIPSEDYKSEANDSSKNGNSLAMAVYVQGNGPIRSNYSELENAWSSVGDFIGRLFGGSSQNLISKLEETKPQDQSKYSVSGSIYTESDLEAAVNPHIVEFNDGSGEKPVNFSRREGRFIFGFLGFGGKAQSETTLFPEKSIDMTTDSSLLFHESQTNGNIFRNDKDLSKVKFEVSEVDTENIKFVSYEDHFLTTDSEHSVNENILSLNASESSTDFNIVQIHTNITDDQCMDCNFESFELPIISNKNSDTDKDLDELPRPTENVFTDEQLETFCMNLVNQLEESQSFLFRGNSSDIEQHFKTTDQIKSSEEHQLNLSSLLNASVEESNTESNVIEDSFFVSNESLLPTIDEPVGHKSENRFINLLGFGSGRSELEETEINGLVSVVQNSVTTEIERLPSALDCESYFRKKQNMKFPKPNLMDMISDPKIKLKDFSNATMSPELQEHQLQLLIDLLKDIWNNSSEKSDVNSGSINTNTVPNGETVFPEEKQILSIGGMGLNIKENETVHPTVSDINWSNEETLKENSNSKVDYITETMRDGRLLNIFGFGSGDGRAQTESSKKDERWFIGSFFGSGEGRLLETSDVFNEFDVNVLKSDDSFKENSFFSGDARTFENPENISETFKTEVPDSRFLGILGFGSGDGRQLNEVSELIQTETIDLDESSCGSDCLLYIYNTTDQYKDCEYAGCGIDNPHIHNFSTESTEALCLNDCLDDSISSNESASDFESCDSCSHQDEISENDDLPIQNISYVECNDCDFVQNTEENYAINISSKIELSSEKLPLVNYSNYTSHCDDCYSDSDLNDKELKSKEGWSKIFLDGDKTNFTTAVELAYTSTELKDLIGREQKTEKSRSLFGTIFLTGSGDGGLFEDAGGPINLVEEDNIRPSDVSPRKRVDEDTKSSGNINSFTESTNLHENSINPSTRSSGRRGKLLEEMTPERTLVTVSLALENSTKPPIHLPGRRGKVLDLDQGYLNPTTENYIEANISHKVSPVITDESFRRRGRLEDELPFDINTKEIFASELSKSVPSNIFTTDSQPRFCISASECNSALNEKCVTKDDLSSICDCARHFVRNKETGKCVAKVVLETSMKLPAEEFNEDLRNPESQRYKQTSRNANETIWILLEDTPELIPIVAGVDVIVFSPGSLVVSWNMVLATERESEAELVQYVESDLKKALQNNNILKNSPLDVRNASLLFTNPLNPCISPELNYCSENAVCVRKSDIPGGYICRCKDAYFDTSRNKMYSGEVCEALCPSDYCGDHGHCEVSENEGRRCMCFGWYFGDRCELSGVVVVATFSSILFIVVLLVVIVLVCKERRHSRRSKRFQGSSDGNLQSMPGRVSDIIALEENVGTKAASFAQIRTPVQNPTIKVTMPSFTESPNSDWLHSDSTFDISPSSGELQVAARLSTPART